MYRVYSTAVLLIIASLPVISVCQTDCAYPMTSDLENVIVDVIMAADSAATPIVTVTGFHPVCLARGQERDRYRFLSVVVEYTCSNNGNCPMPSGDGSAVEQFETECDRGVWDYQVLSHVEYTRTRSPTASFSTTAREDCAFCSSPELISSSSLPHVTDNLTHCVACSQNCSEGLGQCYFVGADSCCSYYNASTCVDACPSPFLPNNEYDCVCPVGTTGYNCSEKINCGSLGDPKNGNVSVSTTTYNSVANYSCNTGYTLTGNMSRTCLDTGLWSGNEPICTEECKVKNCSQCVKDPSVCENCTSGYVLSDNECKCPVESCENCDTDVQKCDICSKDTKFDTRLQECITQKENDESEDGISSAVIAGIVVTVIVLLIVVAIIIIIISAAIFKKKKDTKSSNSEAEKTEET